MRGTREVRKTHVPPSRVVPPVAYVAGARKETWVHERTGHAMETQEGRETRVFPSVSRSIIILITTVIIIVTNNQQTTTSVACVASA